jgi:2-polyprenyl-6-methoxyphenol hydroxylase-like FAD-dependent oxidoreductase
MFKVLRIRKPQLREEPASACLTKDIAGSCSSGSNPTDTPAKDAGRKHTNEYGQRTASSTVSPTTDVVLPKVNDPCLGEEPPADILIAGGGIVGLLFALALKKHLPVTPVIFEQAAAFEPDVGAGMGLYANGLRVIRDIDPNLLRDIQNAGHPYLFRRWEHHDGTEVAVADESVLARRLDQDQREESDGIRTMGIRRWKLQQILHQAVAKAGIPVHFGKTVLSVETPENGMTEVVFTDGSRRQTQLLIGADGGRSVVRSNMLSKTLENSNRTIPTLRYTGTTCIMGVAANVKNIREGISFPVSTTTRCHGAFYPTGADELCFQFHFPVQQEIGAAKLKVDSCWGNLSQQMSREKCTKLAAILEKDGWNEEKYLTPLRQVTRAVRVGFIQLTPALKEWSFPNAKGQPRTILVGDAAHPPVPYIGQGAQQGMEDIGTLAVLLKTFCLDDQGRFDLSNLHHAVMVYEKIRIPRVAKVLANGHQVGNCQAKRAQNPAYNIVRGE